MTTIELRRATPSDAAAILQLTREAYAKWIPITGREPAPMTADYDQAVLTHRFDLLYVDGVFTGLIETVDEGDQLLIENVAIRPDAHGQGHGRRLGGLAENIALGLGYGRVRLFTNKRWEARTSGSTSSSVTASTAKTLSTAAWREHEQGGGRDASRWALAFRARTAGCLAPFDRRHGRAVRLGNGGLGGLGEAHHPAVVFGHDRLGLDR